MLSRFPFSSTVALLGGLLPAAAAVADLEGDPHELPAFIATGQRVANEEPAGTFAMPVSALRFEPLVDLQARNLAEAQGDVTIRGGIFENTGFAVGALNLFDPQTGHYFAEIPISPAMLSGPEIRTGLDNAFSGFNSAVGTVGYRFLPIASRGEVSFGIGEGGLRRGRLLAARAPRESESSALPAIDLEISRSTADGLIEGGDHRFHRYAVRAQWDGPAGRTDAIAAYQSKFFGWPNLYTPFGFQETENLQTRLFLLHHQGRLDSGGTFRLGGYFRRHSDDYEFDRTRPGLINPFEHETEVWAGAAEAELPVGGDRWLRMRGEALADTIESTALIFGRFNSRTYGRGAMVLENRPEITPEGVHGWSAGASVDTTNRDGTAFSPLAGWWYGWRDREDGLWQVSLSAAQTTQVPGYTALNSDPASGLFRGNPGLGRERSRNLEAGLVREAGPFRLETAAFVRRDSPLVDWTFAEGQTARSANPVRITTHGLEAVAWKQWEWVDLAAGYMLLSKSEDYGDAEVDASYYALNYARHRATLALIARPAAGWEVRIDNSVRLQQPNSLRTEGGRRSWLTAVGVLYRPPEHPQWEFSARVSNLWNDSFQDIPAVPAAPRQVSGGIAWRW